MEDLKIKARSIITVIEEGFEWKDVSVPTKDSLKITCRVYTPTAHDGPFRCLVYIHGGGWVLGDLEGEDATCRVICVKMSCVVVSVDYRLAPEHPYPACIDDSWSAFEWTVNSGGTLKLDKSRIIVGGSSSGANLAAVVAHRARDAGIPLLGQVLRIPATCHIDCYPAELGLLSLDENSEGPLLLKESMKIFWGHYNPPDITDWNVSPLLAKNFKGLARTYMQVAGRDPLRDEALAYADKLRAAG